MSRFDRGRWNRVVVWTGAALAWGSALVGAKFEPEREALPEPASVSGPAVVDGHAAFPVPPVQGIVVIRRAFSPESTATPQTSDASPTAAEQPALPPAPVSSGS